ncbi:short-chain dehydrogenase [Intrasporangium chromatireducens Q5-1]|uniref:Short-chain dehydrogenase n=1 Tax=Intrasporangium chromatireducens Q5-1 TaxID=584657 RepID=W9GIS7_9MICO|nr:SDR family oxidoreductase [Intrasporangium chromatireducens]EWT04728.1 short-chain dehydrogenase [Intrasporangium chromatireducens Q5-1]
MSTPRDLGIVYVTGGSSGLGAAVVDAVTQAGGKAAVIDRQAPADESVPFAQADLSDTAAAERAVDELAAWFGPPEAVVTAAGTDACGPLTGVSVEDWERVVRVNLFGTAAVVRACLPHLERTRGTVVTIGSTLGLRPAGDATAYCASKFGVVGFTRALAMELAGRVGVTLVIPGGMRTHFFDGRTEQYRPPPDAALNDPTDVAQCILTALRQPVGCELRELVVAASTEPSWP